MELQTKSYWEPQNSRKLSVEIQLSDGSNFERKVKRDSDRTFFGSNILLDRIDGEETQWYRIA